MIWKANMPLMIELRMKVPYDCAYDSFLAVLPGYQRKKMTITLNHMIVPSHNKIESARFYSRVFGFDYVGEFYHFIVVKVNDTLSLDFDNKETYESHHYAFKVSEQEFDEIFERLKAENIPYGSGPSEPENMRINHNDGGRGVYFRDPAGHLLEMLTVDYKMP